MNGFTGQLGDPNAQPGNFELGDPGPSIINLAGLPVTVSVVAFARYGLPTPLSLAPSTWFYGGVQFPLAETSPNTLLADADPALYQALAFYSFVLNRYLGARFVAASAVIGYQDSKQKPISNLVEMTVGYNPLPFLTDTQLTLPLLALYRVTGEGKQRTVAKSEEWTTWEFALILPPMDAAQSELLVAILHAAELLMEERTEKSSDPAYTPPGGIPGQSFVQIGGLSEMQWVSCRYDNYDGLGDLPAPYLVARLLVKELQGKSPQYGVYQGSTISLSNLDPSSPTPIPVLEIDDWVPAPPTI